MGQPKAFTWEYYNNQPHDVPANFPNRDQVFTLRDVFHERGGSLQHLVSCAGIRYMIVVEPNKSYKDCLENNLLEKLYQACEEKDIDRRAELIYLVLRNCMTGIWSYLEKDFSHRRVKGTLMKPIGLLDYDRTEVHTLQLKTIDGTVHAIASETEDEQSFRPIENKFPGVPCFPVSEIQVLQRISQILFRVKIRGKEYCLKAGSKTFVHSVEKLRRVGNISNVVSLAGVAVDKSGRVIGMLTPFVSGKLLSLVRSATAWQKSLWKEQITTAVISLHECGVVWGDANPHNVLITSDGSEAVLIDLDGGSTYSWVDEQLYDTKLGDLQALESILRFVDILKTDLV